MDGDSGDTARHHRPHSFTSGRLTHCWPLQTEWHQQNQPVREPHGNGSRNGHTTGVFDSPVGGNDLIQNRLLQEALFTVCFQTHQGAQFQARCQCRTNQSLFWGGSDQFITNYKHDFDWHEFLKASADIIRLKATSQYFVFIFNHIYLYTYLIFPKGV